jgi:hypothetical protein
MAHANFHMAAGMATATMITLWPVVRAWRGNTALAPPVGRMLLASYAIGVWALMPSLLTTIGFPQHIHRAWWANAFLGHAVISERVRGGLLIGELVLAAVITFHYVVLVAAIARVRRGSGTSDSG